MIFFVLILFCIKVLNSFFFFLFWLIRFFFVFLFIIIFVIKLYRLVLVFWFDEKGLVKVLIVLVNLFMLLFLLVKIVEISFWWCVCFGMRFVIVLVFVVSWVSFGVMRKNLVCVFLFKVIFIYLEWEFLDYCFCLKWN